MQAHAAAESQTESLYYGWISNAYTVYKSLDTARDSAAAVPPALQPAAALYPWLPTRREVYSSTITTATDSSIPGIVTTTKTQQTTATKALYDSGWNDTTHPPTIDEDFISLSGVALDKTTTGDVWFNASAEPDPDRQFAGLGLIGTVKYTGGNGQKKIVLDPGLQPGRMTVQKPNGQTQTYNIQRAFSLYRLGAIAPVNITFIASSEKSFSVPQAQYRTGKIHNVTGSVWREPATATACLPYIARQHNKGIAVKFAIPMALRSVAGAIAIVGTVQTVGLDRVYITGFAADYTAQSITYTGQVISNI